MKAVNLLFVLFTIGLLSITLSNCGETESPESCAQDEICTGKSVTTCCTNDACVYKYNGKDYQEDELDQLADDLGCTSGGARVASEEKEQLKDQLRALLNKAKAGLH